MLKRFTAAALALLLCLPAWPVDTKISDLPTGTAPQNADKFVIARSGANFQLTWAQMVAAVTSSCSACLQVSNNLADLANIAIARTNLGLGTMALEATTSWLDKAGNLSGLASASSARTNLGLGSIATQAANSVAITGGSITGITDLAIADGGTGASDAAGARTNLGLGTMATEVATDYLAKAGNLAGLADVPTSRTNLGLGTIATQAANNVSISGGAITGTTISGSTGSFTTLAASSTVSGAGFSTYLASPPAIGGTVAAAGSFTTLAASSTVSGSGFSTYLASPPAIGGTAAAAGTFTPLTSTGLLTTAGEDSITAFAGGGQGSATALSATKNLHRVTTVATAGDSVKLPAALVGQAHYVRNDGATAMKVYGQSTETINGVASATGVLQSSGMGVWYVCTAAGQWTTTPALSMSFSTAGNIMLMQSASIGWSNSNSDPGAAATSQLSTADGSNILRVANGASAQIFRIYGTTTGPKYLSLSHNGTDGVVDTSASSGLLSLAPTNATSVTIGKPTLIATGSAANQLRASQATAPTCSTNCGTSPSVAGTDTAMIVTMGASGVPASGWVVTFNGTWAAAPSCVVQMALAGMVVGKQALTAATTTTTVTVVTNGTAPANSDKYAIHCIGVS
jgi:hypothetical protein